MTEPRIEDNAVQNTAPGMERFFSPMNLNRYRKLAAGTIDASERSRLLQVLGEEMNAFRREARAATGNRHDGRQSKTGR